jgi:hypothetical protein
MSDSTPEASTAPETPAAIAAAEDERAVLVGSDPLSPEGIEAAAKEVEGEAPTLETIAAVEATTAAPRKTFEELRALEEAEHLAAPLTPVRSDAEVTEMIVELLELLGLEEEHAMTLTTDVRARAEAFTDEQEQEFGGIVEKLNGDEIPIEEVTPLRARALEMLGVDQSTLPPLESHEEGAGVIEEPAGRLPYAVCNVRAGETYFAPGKLVTGMTDAELAGLEAQGAIEFR